MYQRSWLKLCMISLNPSPIFPSTCPVGTRAFSNVTYAVPAAGE